MAQASYDVTIERPSSFAPSPRAGRWSLLLNTLRAIGSALVTLCILSALLFVAMNFHSGDDFARNVLGHAATQQQVHAYAVSHHLDDPLPQRYIQWASGFVRGDWGVSWLTGFPVGPDILQRLPRTMLLAGLALPLGSLIGVSLGAFAAVRIGSRSDLAITLATAILAGLPTFVIAISLLIAFAVTFQVVPLGSFALAYGSPDQVAEAFILPTVTLALAMVPQTARITRAAVRDVLTAPYVQAAVLRGLPFRTVLWTHAVRNAVGPIANIIGLEAIELLAGVIVVENVFSFPGIGQALLTAVSAGDVQSVETIVMIMGITFVSITLITDLVVLYFNPRLRLATR